MATWIYVDRNIWWKLNSTCRRTEFIFDTLLSLSFSKVKICKDIDTNYFCKCPQECKNLFPYHELPKQARKKIPKQMRFWVSRKKFRNARSRLRFPFRRYWAFLTKWKHIFPCKRYLILSFASQDFLGLSRTSCFIHSGCSIKNVYKKWYLYSFNNVSSHK